MLANRRSQQLYSADILSLHLMRAGRIYDRMPDGTQFPGHGGMDDLTTERSFDS